MLNNYFNPQGMDPGVGWKPTGALGGMIYGDRERKYEDAVSLQDAMARISTQMEQEKLNTYRADDPVRGAERGAKISGFGVDEMLSREKLGNKDYAPAFVRGEIGKADEQYAKGTTAKGTMQSGIDATNLKNVVSGLESAGRQLELMVAANPIMGEMEYKAFLERVPAGVKNMFPAQYSPEVGKTIQRISNAIKDSPEHRRTMEVEDSKAATAENNNTQTNWTNWIIANLRSEKDVEVARLRQAVMQNKENFQQYLSRYMRRVASGQPVSQEEHMAAKAIETMLYQMRSAAPGAIDPNAAIPQVFPDITPRPTPPSAIPNRVPEGAQVPMAPGAIPQGWNDEKEKRLQELYRKRSQTR